MISLNLLKATELYCNSDIYWMFKYLIGYRTLVCLDLFLNPLSANPKNGQTHSNNSSAVADELFERV